MSRTAAKDGSCAVTLDDWKAALTGDSWEAHRENWKDPFITAEECAKLAYDVVYHQPGMTESKVVKIAEKVADEVRKMRKTCSMMRLWEDGLISFSWDEKSRALQIHAHEPF